MSTKVIQTCDRCERSGSPEEIQLRGVFLRVGTNLHDYGGAQVSHTHHSEWCDNCVRELGLWPPAKGSPPPIEPPPTLEQIIRAMVLDFVRDA